MTDWVSQEWSDRTAQLRRHPFLGGKGYLCSQLLDESC